jgi:hypothetical protein
MDRHRRTRRVTKAIERTAETPDPAHAEVVRVIRFDWATRSGTQPIVYLDRRWLN